MNSYKINTKEWVEQTNAVGIRAKPGRYGGTYAHKDIAFEFGMWISPEFKVYLIDPSRPISRPTPNATEPDSNIPVDFTIQ